MQQINAFFTTLHQYIGGNNWFIFLLLGTGFFFTLYLKFPQIRYFRHAIRIIKGKYDKKSEGMVAILEPFIDTIIIWNLSMLTVAFMTVPNLIGLLILHREVKQTIGDYWIGFKKEYTNEEI
jgi:Na+/alanine symporter